MHAVPQPSVLVVSAGLIPVGTGKSQTGPGAQTGSHRSIWKVLRVSA